MKRVEEIGMRRKCVQEVFQEICLLGTYELTEARVVGSSLGPEGVTSAGAESHAPFSWLISASQPAPPTGSLLVPHTRMGGQRVSPQTCFPQAHSLVSSPASFHALRPPGASCPNTQRWEVMVHSLAPQVSTTGSILPSRLLLSIK